MPNILIDGELYEWTPAVAPGDGIGPYENLLTEIYLQRIAVRARYFASKTPAPDRETIQAEILRISSEFVFSDEPEPDAVETEALEIAEETIRTRLAEAGLPPPKSLRDHAQQIMNEPSIIAEAKRRVQTRAQVAREILGAPSSGATA